MEKLVEYTAVGRRKESVARVRLRPGSGKIKLNEVVSPFAQPV